jgi:inorganic triphosphatase YgiF
MAIETELKLSFSAKDLSSLLEHPLLQVTGKRQKLYNIYYDTPELALMHQGIAVRERKILRKLLLTLKINHTNSGGLSSRSEWEAPTVQGQFDFQTLIDDPVIAQKMTLLAPQLVPIFTTDFTRRSWEVVFRGATIEIAIDQGLIVTKRDNQLFEEPISEVELELKAGNPVTLFGLARVLSRRVRLHPSAASKAERGYQLFKNITPSPIKPPSLDIDPKATPLQSFERICLECLNHLQVNDVGILRDDDDEYIHQARVAMRRIRSAIKLFSPVLPMPFVHQWNTTWRDLANELGDARNWDVFTQESLPLIKGAFPNQAEIEALEKFSVEQRAKAHAKAVASFGSRTYSVKLISFAEAVMSLSSHPEVKNRQKMVLESQSTPEPMIEEDTQAFATRLLKRRHRRFMWEVLVPNHNLEQSHQLRLDLKKLRYSFDFFMDLYPKRRMSLYMKSLARSQELLGQMNDLATAEALLATRNLPHTDIVQAWVMGRQSGYLSMMPKVLASLSDLKAPWKS